MFHTWKIDELLFGVLFIYLSETLFVNLEYLLELLVFNLLFVDKSKVRNLIKLLRK